MKIERYALVVRFGRRRCTYVFYTPRFVGLLKTRVSAREDY
jgi:hypothetical protein